MHVLDLKLFRDVKRLWAQALAIALVIAGAVAALVLAVGSFRSLEETRNAYYERYRFADVFASVRRAPKTLIDRIAEIPGVAAVDARIAKLALLDIPNFREPATGQFISLPEVRKSTLNQLYMRIGRVPEPLSSNEVVVSESFANAHGFAPGSRFSAILNGRKRELVIVGIALSPEFIYAVGPGDIMPDDRRFGIVWMSEKALASAFDLEGAFSSVNRAKDLLILVLPQRFYTHQQARRSACLRRTQPLHPGRHSRPLRDHRPACAKPTRVCRKSHRTCG